jgi:ribosomal protein S18 acetylase RimI-like enzyme
VDPTDLRHLDEIAADATPAAIEQEVAGWWCKADPDLPFRRANVARPPLGVGHDAEAVRRSLAVVRSWYAARGQRLIVQVSAADPAAAALDQRLAAAGLAIEAPVLLMVSTLADLGRSTDPRWSPAVRGGIDEAWGRGPGSVVGADPDQVERAAAYGRMLAPAGAEVLAATIADADGATLGMGIGVLDRGWVGVFAMATAPGHRRQGIARSIVEALATAATERGAVRAYLQVETDNAPAIACYERAGFTTSHGYHYRSDGLDPLQGC